jgi:hypothetical protein
VRERNFDSQYVLSYVGKPFMGMILGSMIYLMVYVVMRVLKISPSQLGVLASGEISDTTAFAAILFFFAMLTGFKENLAFNMLNRLIKAVFGDESPPEQGSEPPSSTSTSGV